MRLCRLARIDIDTYAQTRTWRLQCSLKQPRRARRRRGVRCNALSSPITWGRWARKTRQPLTHDRSVPAARAPVPLPTHPRSPTLAITAHARPSGSASASASASGRGSTAGRFATVYIRPRSGTPGQDAAFWAGARDAGQARPHSRSASPQGQAEHRSRPEPVTFLPLCSRCAFAALLFATGSLTRPTAEVHPPFTHAHRRLHLFCLISASPRQTSHAASKGPAAPGRKIRK